MNSDISRVLSYLGHTDCICIGDNEVHHFCFPKDKTVPVAKLRLATEEMYKRTRKRA